MLKITDKLKEKEILVTKGAYENLYKSLGYTIVGEKKTTVKKEEIPEPVVSEPAKKDDNDDIFEQIMNKKQDSRKKK